MATLPYSLYCFDAVGKVFGDWVDSIASEYNLSQDEIECEVEASVSKLRDEYYSNQVPDIPFSDQFLRWSYVYWAAPANALLFESVLKNDPDLQEFLGALLQERKTISVCCIGGGPGSEVLGLAKWIERQQLGPTQLDVLVSDIFPEWGENWEALKQHINTAVGERPAGQSNASWLEVGGRFIKVDATGVSEAQKIGGAFDLYIASYLVSHIFSTQELHKFNQFMCEVVSKARLGSKFIFIDRAANSDMWKWPFRAIQRRSQLSLSGYRPVPDVQEEEPGEGESSMSNQVKGLLPLVKQGNAFWVVGTKV